MNIPILSYILRKLRENLEAIKKALRTGKETEGKTKKRPFLGIFKVISGKKFKPLKLKRKKWSKQKRK